VVVGSAARSPSKTNDAPLCEDFSSERQAVDLGFTYEEAFKPIGDCSLKFDRGNDSAAMVVETPRERWSYAIEVDLSRTAEGGGGRWIEILLIVESGQVGLGILNPERSDFIAEKVVVALDGQAQEVSFLVDEIGRAGNVIFRNATDNDE